MEINTGVRLCTGIKQCKRSKGKCRPRTGHEDPEGEYSYSSTLSFTTTLDGVGVQATSWPLYPQERYPVPIVQEAGWAPGPVWTGAENLAATGIRSPDFSARSESLYRLIYRGP